jgi:hypothetical protein
MKSALDRVAQRGHLLYAIRFHPHGVCLPERVVQRCLRALDFAVSQIYLAL